MENIENKNPNAIAMLKNMRDNLDSRIKHHKVVSFVLLGILLIEFIIFSMIETASWLGMIGVFATFIWLGSELITMLSLVSDQHNIDNFYLEVVLNEKEKR